MPKVAIVSPTYNEIGNIENFLTRLQHVANEHKEDSFSVFIIDDSSPDGTADLVKVLAPKLKTKNFSITLLVRKEKDGLGRAYIHGFKHVLRHKDGFEYVLQMDADLSHDPAYITGFLYQAREGADFIVASRYMNGGGTPDWSWYRKLLSYGGNIYTRMLLGNKITDYTGGYNMYKASLLRKMDVSTITSGGYGFQIELKHRSLGAASSVRQIPIVFIDRKHGSSKIPRNTLLKNLVLVLAIRTGRLK